MTKLAREFKSLFPEFKAVDVVDGLPVMKPAERINHLGQIPTFQSCVQELKNI